VFVKAPGFKDRLGSKIRLISDRETIAKLADAASADNSLLVCHGCEEVDRIVVGVLVIRETEEAWMLCGPCLRQISVQGQIAS
jgi:hypothetical protein